MYQLLGCTVLLSFGFILSGCGGGSSPAPDPSPSPSPAPSQNYIQKQRYQVLMPKPKSHTSGGSVLQIGKAELDSIEKAAESVGKETATIVKAQLMERLPGSMHLSSGQSPMTVTFLHNVDRLPWEPLKARNETYGLSIDGTKLTIDAKSSWALSNAMATLYQLMEVKKADGGSMQLSIPRCPHNIVDTPAYPYRGLLVDTSRSFYPVSWLKDLIVHMSEFKLNVLHLHLTDTASWPLEVDGYPQLTEYLSYRDINNEKLTYNRTAISGLVEFGRLRGVSIVPEIDGPAHAPALGYQDSLRLTVAASAEFSNDDWAVEAPAGTWNYSNASVVGMLADVLQQLDADFTTAPYLHVGGDEPRASSLCMALTDESLKSRCLKSCTKQHGGNPYAPNCAPMNARPAGAPSNMTYWFPDVLNSKVQDYFDAILAKRSAGMRPIQAWSGTTYTMNVTLPSGKDTMKPVLQLWQFPAPSTGNVESDRKMATNVCENYDIVQSSATHPQWQNGQADKPVDAGWMYLECGESANWISMGQNYWCSRASWTSMYSMDLKQSSRPGMDTDTCKDAFIGGEIAIWGETTGVGNAMSLIFPRAAAFAERAWSNPASLTWKELNAQGQPPLPYWNATLKDALHRMNAIVANLDLQGVPTSRMQPKFCFDHPEYCSGYTEPILPGTASQQTKNTARIEV